MKDGEKGNSVKRKRIAQKETMEGQLATNMDTRETRHACSNIVLFFILWINCLQKDEHKFA